MTIPTRTKKAKPWRGRINPLTGNMYQPSESPHNCTVYPDNCDPTPAAAKRLIKAALAWVDADEETPMSGIITELIGAAAAYRKSTAAKKGKKP